MQLGSLSDMNESHTEGARRFGQSADVLSHASFSSNFLRLRAMGLKQTVQEERPQSYGPFVPNLEFQ
jgi:hypothetical protein